MNSFSKLPSIDVGLIAEGEVSMGVVVMDIRGLVKATISEAEEKPLKKGSSQR